MNCYKFVRAASQLSQMAMKSGTFRVISTTSVRRQSFELIQFKKRQADMQCEDGKPVFLKAGFSDRVLYMTTWALALFGLLNNLLVIFYHAKPQSWK